MLRIDLNAGCGDHHPPGWVNADIDPACDPDMCCDLTGLPAGDGTAGRIFASHVLEHNGYHDQLPLLLAEFRRVLADDGELCVVGPDIERAVILRESYWLLDLIIAWPPAFGSWPAKIPPRGHAWTATGPLVEHALTSAGFTFTSWTGRLKDLEAAGWPVVAVHADWQNAYTCRKGLA